MGLPEGVAPVNQLTKEDKSRGGSVISPLKLVANAMRHRKYCDVRCPFADVCPMLPLSMAKDYEIVLETGSVKHPCKLKDAPAGVQRRIQNMFLNGEDGLLNEIKSALFVAGQNLGTDAKERLAYADSMMKLHKVIYGEKVNSNTTEPIEIRVRQLVVQPDGSTQAQEVQLNKTETRKLIRQTNAQAFLDRDKPPELPEDNDPESLMTSPILDVIMKKPDPEDTI